MTTRRPDPSHAIAAKKATAAANRHRIAMAINVLRSTGCAVNVQSVAREASVSSDTVRRSGDLFIEIKHLRGSNSQANVAGPPPERAQEVALKARLVAALTEVVDLRRELAAARRTVHQALGEQGAHVDPQMVDELRRDNAELSVAVMDLQRQVEELTGRQEQVIGELLAAQELNREYVRELNQARAAADAAEAELVSVRRGTLQH